MSKIVVALGGNALGKTPEEQLKLLEKVSKIIVKLVKDGNDVVLSHGNGPQVGQIALAMDYAANGEVATPEMPFAECGSMSQGYIGYQMQQCIQDEFARQGIEKDCVTIVTQVLVDAEDPAFQNPTKPIGGFYTKEEADAIAKEKGYTFVEDSGRGYRRVVPSPKPVRILERNVIKELVDKKVLVIAAGGGGIPVVNRNKKKLLEGVDAVIDKDRSSALLAKEVGADLLLILTAVDKVSIRFNTPEQKNLDSLTIEEAEKYIAAGEFGKGSMQPKVEACLDFVKQTGNNAIISSLEKADLALQGKTGTVIKGQSINKKIDFGYVALLMIVGIVAGVIVGCMLATIVMS